MLQQLILKHPTNPEVLDFSVKHALERYGRDISNEFLRVRLLGVVLAAMGTNCD
jgi:hypothetical protein